MLRAVCVSAIVAYAAAFSSPSAFMGTGLKAQAATRSSAITMSAADESISRRAALGAFLAGAAAIPAAANAAYDDPKGKDPNFQLKQSGRLTDVQSSAVSGVRTSAFGKGVFGNQKASKQLERTPLSDADIDTVSALADKVMGNSAIKAKGYKTSNKVGINPAYGGSSGIFTGAK